jgi:glutaredoxin
MIDIKSLKSQDASRQIALPMEHGKSTPQIRACKRILMHVPPLVVNLLSSNRVTKIGKMEGRTKKVRLFALSTCPNCKNVKRLLEKYSIEYEDIEVDALESGEQWLMSKELKKYNPKATYPTLVVEEVLTEIDEESLKKALELG